MALAMALTKAQRLMLRDLADASRLSIPIAADLEKVNPRRTIAALRRLGLVDDDNRPTAGGLAIITPMIQEDRAWVNRMAFGSDGELVNEMAALLAELIDIEGPCPGTATWAEKVRALLTRIRYLP
jgi:hypothetical protein